MSRKPATSPNAPRRIRARGPLPDMRRAAVPIAAFAITAVGLYALTADGSTTTEVAPDGVATVVATRAVAAGASTAEIIAASEVRMLPATARAEGALTATDAVPSGILVTDLVPGQQVLSSSVADDVVDALGDGLVAVSVRLDPQRWSGPFTTTGDIVDVHEVADTGTTVLATEVRIVATPDTAELDPRSEQVITLAVPSDTVGAVITAAADNRLWLVGS